MSFNYYNNSFFDELTNNSYTSGKKILSILSNLVKFESMIDIGAGLGPWTKAFIELKNKHNCIAIDGDYVQKNKLLIPEENFISIDVSKPFDLKKKFDLAISMEVGEHLPHASSKDFIESITKHADVVLFSAAIPGQQGTYHINEQYPEYWAAIFNSLGYTTVDLIRDIIWDDTTIDRWYRQNTLLFIKDTELYKYPTLALKKEKEKLTKIHPEAFEYFSKRSSSLQTWKGFINNKLYLLKKTLRK
jgi:cyclopropane fatty-acyl-phospholipid synthase-like methyltransferase